ncbi:hypothetical protein HOY82DRAFT_491380 [Tuber indicum]|nr:hypothetical protein HOY82DRAFT_491380 [Tuber indicum]
MVSSQPSSPLLSPSALLQELVEKGTAAIQKQNDTRTLLSRQVILENAWNLPNSDSRDGVVTKLPPKRKRALKPTGDPIAKISRARGNSITPTLGDFLAKSKVLGEAGAKNPTKPKTKNTRKKGVTMNEGQIVAKTAKKSMPTKSPFFAPQDAAEVPSKPVIYGNPSSIPQSPTKLITEPPIPLVHREWTPVKDTVISIDSSPTLGGIETGEGKDTKGRGTLDFANMVSEMKLSSSYSRDGSALASLGGLNKSSNGLIKKRAIEILNLPSNSNIASSEPRACKYKQPRKKTRTITGQATTQYREAKEATSHSLLNYFALEDAASESAVVKKLTRKRKTASATKRDSSPAPKLLSPKAAKRQFDETECIFGSSSQLEVMAEIETVDNLEPAEDEDTPDYIPPSTSIVRRNFLKTLTKDRKGGNKLVGTRHWTNIGLLDVSTVEDFGSHSEEFPMEQPMLPESRLGRRTVSKLWDAAARDLDGGLLSVEVVDMSVDNGILSLPSSPGPVEVISTARSSSSSEGPALPDPTGTVEDEPVPNLRIEGHLTRPPSIVVQGEDMRNLQVESQPANSAQKNGVGEEFIPHLRTEDMPPVKLKRFVIPDADDVRELSFDDFAKTSDRASSMIPKSVTTSVVDTPTSRVAALVNSSATTFNPDPQVQPEPSMPNYNAWITTKLKAEVAKYGFKDLKTRPRMISMLEECWLAKSKRNIEQDTNKGLGAAATKTLTQRTRSTSPTFTHLPQSGWPNSSRSQGYSTTTAPGASKFRGNRPTIRRYPTESGVPGPPDRGRSLTRRDQPLTHQSMAKQLAVGNSPGTSIPYPRKSQSPSNSLQSTPPLSPKRKAKKHKQKQTVSPFSSSKSPSKSVSPSRSRSRSKSPKLSRKMISRIILDIEPGSEGCRFSHAILMYDPISVEELAEWLNARGIMEGGFGKHTVTTKDVKNWCISKGICCFSEDGWRVKRKK